MTEFCKDSMTEFCKDKILITDRYLNIPIKKLKDISFDNMKKMFFNNYTKYKDIKTMSYNMLLSHVLIISSSINQKVNDVHLLKLRKIYKKKDNNELIDFFIENLEKRIKKFSKIQIQDLDNYNIYELIDYEIFIFIIVRLFIKHHKYYKSLIKDEVRDDLRTFYKNLKT